MKKTSFRDVGGLNLIRNLILKFQRALSARDSHQSPSPIVDLEFINVRLVDKGA